MQNIIIWGYATQGIKCYRDEIANNVQFCFLGFADNDPIKQNKYVNNNKVYSLDNLIELRKKMDFSVIIASRAWLNIREQLKKEEIEIVGFFENGKLKMNKEMTFEQLDLSKNIKLYAGTIYDEVHYNDPDLFGLSIDRVDEKHIFHDITNKYPLPDNCISNYQAEDVLEHIGLEKIVLTINEIYRILKPGALFRICLPDYFSSYLSDITLKNENGECVFDPTGGGVLKADGVYEGGHVWFPTYKKMKEILDKTFFQHYDFLCYHTEDGELVKREIDFSKGYINRVPQHNNDQSVIYSIVIDCIK